MRKARELMLDINYGKEQVEFTELVRQIELENSDKIEDEYSEDIALITEGLNILYCLMSCYTWLVVNPHIALLSKTNDLIFNSLHKNQIAFYTSLKLTRLGLYGPARAIIRHIFESLIIAKYCSVSHSSIVYDRWKEGDVIYFGNAVLKKIRKPDTGAFREFWEILSNYTHSTIYSQQISLNVVSDSSNINLNFVYIRMLLECQYHLFLSHFITRSMHDRIKRYSDVGKISSLKKRMDVLFTQSQRNLLQRPREIIRDYRATWDLITKGNTT